MNAPSLDQLVSDIRSWPVEDLAELAEFARVIEARRTGVYTTSLDEREAIDEALAQLNSGKFADGLAITALATRIGR